MALIIEDGTGVADADSFITLADARTAATRYGLELSTDDTTAEAQLVQSYFFLVDNYESRMTGYVSNYSQTGLFPRTACYKNQDYLIDSDVIPAEVIRAQVYCASGINSGADVTKVNTDGVITSFNVQGVYSETLKDSTVTTLPQFNMVSRMLNCFSRGGMIYREEY